MAPVKLLKHGTPPTHADMFNQDILASIRT
jgi:hypothetical protein